MLSLFETCNKRRQNNKGRTSWGADVLEGRWPGGAIVWRRMCRHRRVYRAYADRVRFQR